MPSGVYQIYNLINDKRYIGSAAISIKDRWSHHQSELKGNCHKNIHLQRSWNKHGEDNFIFEVLFTCAPPMCIWYEQQVLDQWKPKYNINPTAGSNLGRKFSVEARSNMSKAHMGHKHTDEQKSKISKSNMGHEVTEETKIKLRKANIGYKNPSAKFTDLDVYEIRRLYATGKVTQKLLGKMFRTDQTHISKLVNHKLWRHLL